MLQYLLTASLTVAALATPPGAENVADFDSLDLNSDGAISLKEFEKWYKTQSESGGALKSSQLFQQYDADGNGELAVSEFVPLAYALSRKSAVEGDNKLDVNGDGVITPSEVENTPEKIPVEIVQGLFQVADTDRDGKITQKEFQQVAGAFDGQYVPQEARNLGLAQSLLVSIDQNRDDKASPNEVFRFANQFNKVSEAEVADVFRILDTNVDGYLTVNELSKLPEKVTKLVGIQPMSHTHAKL
ncbi:Protein H10E21.4 [Aphelenchoides avenae]|nr:Protein H10E21.4 [Aphelenchus avenae]